MRFDPAGRSLPAPSPETAFFRGIDLHIQCEPIDVVNASEFPGRALPNLEEIRRGNEEAFDALFRAFYPRLCGYLVRFTHSSEVAEELVQEVFTAIWERRTEWNPKGSMGQYLFRAARNRALKHRRRQEVRDRLRGEVLDRLGELPPTPEEVFAGDEIAAAAQEAIANLPERCREIFLLSREGALTYTEIAQLLEVSVKTVESQMGRALKRIRAAVLPYAD